MKALKQFAVPSLLGITAPNAPKQVVDGVTLTAEEFLLRQLVKFQNGSALAVPFGSIVQPIMVPGTGISFLDAFNFLNQEIVYAILLTTRATREAQFGSRADAQQGGDIMSLLVQYGRDMASEELRNKVLKFFVRLNFGTEVAEKFTPYVYMGEGEPQDMVARWNAYANLEKSGSVTESMRPALRAKVGLPMADPKIDAQFAEKEAEKQAKALADQAEAEKSQEGENNPEEKKPVRSAPSTSRKAA
jgi:hypothetical protein